MDQDNPLRWQRMNSLVEQIESRTNNIHRAIKSSSTQLAEILMKETGDDKNKNETILQLQEEVRTLQQRCLDLENQILLQPLSSSLSNLSKSKLSSDKDQNQDLDKNLYLKQNLDKERQKWQSQLTNLQSQLSQEESAFLKYREETEDKIRRMLEELLGLKGQIRSICRIKPFSCTLPLGFTNDRISLPSKSLEFGFASVLGPTASQTEVFLQVEDLIFSVTKGYRVSLLAYGPTGSGKTYTMAGTSTEPGIVPRALDLLARELERLEGLGWEVRVKPSTLEVYNDKIVSEQKGDYSRGVEEAQVMFQGAASSRRVGSTACNTRSSRSHLLVQLEVNLSRRSNSQWEEIKGVLCIVDLAGSERVSQSKAEGIRLQETGQINKSLSALGDVVAAIQQKSAHIPYRNSQLTRLLQSTLGSGAKTAFLFNIDPGVSLAETVVTLRFSQRVQACQLGPQRVTTSTYTHQ
ncbi:kinesin family member C1 [Nematocida homosporus]|uniref:kinesin family member C1 n=1 Tax=Nematocida homosporus TaxID=1912981 RepID=UPI002220311E|nr:kinesin family member C1 [Nematocida homosporus]KAI5186362.1 kinesin family member C1 [Nematocida homosporus]